MADTPERCPTCGTAVPDGAPRCPGCGRVFGEANRCPHCHAVAAVIPRGGITVCAACGKPRTGTVVLGGGQSASIVPASHDGRAASTSAMLSRARGRVQRGFGILSLGAGVLTAVLAAALLPGALGIGLAVAAGLLGVGVGALSIRAGAKSMQGGDREELRARETAVIELAEQRGGALTATDVAKAFGMRLDDADALLTQMVGDGSRISVDVDDEGVVRYVFRELARSAARVRVETEPELHEIEVPARRERERAERG